MGEGCPGAALAAWIEAACAPRVIVPAAATPPPGPKAVTDRLWLIRQDGPPERVKLRVVHDDPTTDATPAEGVAFNGSVLPECPLVDCELDYDHHHRAAEVHRCECPTDDHGPANGWTECFSPRGPRDAQAPRFKRGQDDDPRRMGQTYRAQLAAAQARASNAEVARALAEARHAKAERALAKAERALERVADLAEKWSRGTYVGPMGIARSGRVVEWGQLVTALGDYAKPDQCGGATS